MRKIKKLKKTDSDTLGYNLMFGGLLAIDLIILQDLIALGKLDKLLLTAAFCLAVAIPILAGGLMVNTFENKAGYRGHSCLMMILISIGVLGDLYGLLSVFGHISSDVANIFSISVLVSGFIYISYLTVVGLTKTEPQVMIAEKSETQADKSAPSVIAKVGTFLSLIIGVLLGLERESKVKGQENTSLKGEPRTELEVEVSSQKTPAKKHTHRSTDILVSIVVSIGMIATLIVVQVWKHKRDE